MSGPSVGLVLRDHPLQEDACLVGGATKNPYRLLRWLRRAVDITGVVVGERTVDTVTHGYRVRGRALRHLRLYPRTLAWNVANAPAVLSLARRSDVLQCHHPHLGLAAAFARRLGVGRVRLVVKAHGTAVPELAANRYGGLRGLVLRANAAVHLRHDRFVLRSADACVVSSDHQVAELVELYRVDRRRVRTIRNGFDPDFLRVPAEAGARPRGPHLVFVGRLVPKKGLDHLLDVQALLRERFPEARLTLVLGHRAAVEHRPTLRMVEERTRALPGCELRFDLREDELFDVLADADVGVVPSRGYESIPTVVLEMLGSGLPVFATHRWGVPEVLAERFALSGDAVADARTLGDFVVGELPTWDRAAWAARHRCHGYDRLVGEYLSLYDELLDATGSAS